MAADNNQPLQAWTCAKCGATLPAEARTGEVVTCSSCGTPFKSPGAQVQAGAVTISGGSVVVGGDIVAGDLVKVSPPAPSVKVEPVTAVTPEAVVKPAPKLSWWEKVKRLFAN
jgi:hypothetical protein